jgi:hypothetical protein
MSIPTDPHTPPSSPPPSSPPVATSNESTAAAIAQIDASIKEAAEQILLLEVDQARSGHKDVMLTDRLGRMKMQIAEVRRRLQECAALNVP